MSLVRDQHAVEDAIPRTKDGVRAMIGGLAVAMEAMHKKMAHRVQVIRAASRRRESKGAQPEFAVGDYIVMARVRPPGKTSKMMPTWTGPRRVIDASSVHVYQVQDIVSDKVTNVQVGGLTSTKFFARNRRVRLRRVPIPFYQGKSTSKLFGVRRAPHELFGVSEPLAFYGNLPRREQQLGRARTEH